MLTQTQLWRHEWKFALPQSDPAALQALVMQHPAGFRPVFAQREVRNIYLDTPALDTYQANLAGVGLRRKYRLRWYGMDWGTLPAARWETKIKDNQLGRKEIVEQAAGLDVLAMRADHWLVYTPKSWPDDLLPTLVNAYQRAYYLSFDGQIRLTLDWNQRFWRWPITHAGQTPPPDARSPVAVVELKFPDDQLALAREVAQHLPFPRTKHSKYGVGVEALL